MTDQAIDVEHLFPGIDTSRRSPALGRINGFGTGLYGRRDTDHSSGLYVKTQCITALFVPLIALRSYVVADGPGGWHVLGRVPVSGFAKVWNLVALTVAVSLVVLTSFGIYALSPDQRFERQMAQAQAMADRGDIADATRKYRDLASGTSDRASEADAAMARLVEDTLTQGPAGQSVGVMHEAVAYARNRHGVLGGLDLVALGMDAAQRFTNLAPRDRLAMLDAVEPMLNETRRADWYAARLDMLRVIVDADPNDLPALTELAAVYESRNELESVRSLLMPHIDMLGQTEGARMLGQILAAEGDYDRAYPLLQPYINAKLAEMNYAEEELNASYDAVSDAAIRELENNKGPQSWYARYDRATPDEQTAMVQTYIERKLDNDADFQAASERFQSLVAVVPAALDLGIVRLDRARAMSDPDARRTELEAAEQTFLAIQGVAGGDAAYQLYLGQVYYWLGKADEGKALFDQLLAGSNNDVNILAQVAGTLRQVGETERARALFEQAYDNAPSATYKFAIAEALAAMGEDAEEQILWLERCNPDEPHTQASLEHSRGRLAQDEGDTETAAAHYLEACRVYDTMPESSATLNNSALVWQSRYEISGDITDLNQAVDRLVRATELEPDNSILLNNAAGMMLKLVYERYLGDDLDLYALEAHAEADMFTYLYRDAAGRDAYRAQITADPMFVKAQAMMQRAVVLSPKRASIYYALSGLHTQTGDVAALQRLVQNARQAQPDIAVVRAAFDDARSPDYDERSRTQHFDTINILESVIETPGYTPATAAAARLMLVGKMVELDSIGTAADADRMVALVEEAERLHPSDASAETLKYVLIFRAAHRLAGDYPLLTDLRQRLGRHHDSYNQFILALELDADLRAAAAQDPDIIRTVALTLEQQRRFPNDGASRRWALLRQVAPAEASASAEVLRNDPRVQHSIALNYLITPFSSNSALAYARSLEITGDSQAAQQVLDDYAAMGYPMP